MCQNYYDKIVFEEKVLNLISVYVPQVRCEGSKKEGLGEKRINRSNEYQEMKILKLMVILIDMQVMREYIRIHEGYGFGERNEAGKCILDIT